MKAILYKIQRRLKRIRDLFNPPKYFNIFALDLHDFRSGLGSSAWMLYGLVRQQRPEVCVEIGSALGKSAVFVGSALAANGMGRLYAIDPHGATEWNDVDRHFSSYDEIRRNLRHFRVEQYVEIVRELSTQAGKTWSRPIDVLFIDGAHGYEDVKMDWELFSPHVKPQGIVVIHDTMWHYMKNSPEYREDMGVPKFVDELRLSGYPVITFANDYGVSLVQPVKGGFPLITSNI